MSTATAKLSNYRQAPRKVRLLANLIKGKSVELALVELDQRAKRAAPVVSKLIRSAVANAKIAGLNEKTLIVSDIRVDGGVVLKRSMPRAQGRAFQILKRSSHIAVTVSDQSEKAEKKSDKKPEVKPEKKVTEKPAAKKTVKAAKKK